jgi:glutathione S-transferase
MHPIVARFFHTMPAAFPAPFAAPFASPSKPTLYSFRRCPYAIRARMALGYTGIAVDICEVALRQKPAALLAISPKATVPVLHLPTGEVIDQSLDIMAWALHQSDPADWRAAGNPTQTTQAQRWITLNDEVFKPLLDRYKYPNRHPELSTAEHHSRALNAFIHPLDTQLQTTRYLLGAKVSLADVAIFPFVRQFAMVDQPGFDALPLPGVQAWLAGWLDSALFEAVMAKPAPGVAKAVNLIPA